MAKPAANAATAAKAANAVRTAKAAKAAHAERASVNIVLGERWSALARLGLDVEAIGSFDTSLARETRVLVPVDVQALFVPAGSTEPMVRLPLSITAADGASPQPATPYLQDGPPRPAGVHLHWAMPDALLRGSLADRGQGNRLALPPLPDRWLVLRLLVPRGATQPAVRGWVLEADRGRVVALQNWPAPISDSPPMRTVPRADLNGSVGGSLNWSGIYDAAINRFALHDKLEDLVTLAPQGVEADQIGYTVMGWWSDTALDPLDSVHTDSSLHERLRTLGWALVQDRENNDRAHNDRAVMADKRASLGLRSATRYQPASLFGRVFDSVDEPTEPLKAKAGLKPMSATLADGASKVIHSEPSWPRSSLLHGSVYGVPVRAGPGLAVGPDPRPAPAAVDAVWGEHGADVAAAMVANGLEPANATARREYERLFSAFTGHLMDRVDSQDGMIDIQEWEHAAGMASRPGGDGGVDRLLEGAESGPLAAGRQARGMARSAAAAMNGEATGKAPVGTRLSFGKTKRQIGVHASGQAQREEMGRWGRTEKERATEGKQPGRSSRSEPAVREVRRPAPRLYVPMEPVIAVRGVGRSLRHGGDGGASDDGKLNCRYPSQVISAIEQVVSGAELLPSLGTAAVPDEALLLAREALLHNPWLAKWVATTAARLHAVNPAAASKRMVAEAALRFGSTQAVYDGKSGAFSRAVKTVGGRTRSAYDDRIADQLRRFSMVRGVDPDPVAITAWSQPWVPMWLEWELQLHADDALSDWQLGSVDYEPRQGSAEPAAVRTLQGRSVLTTGIATTLSLSIRQWMEEEDRRDVEGRGEASETAEAALGRIAAAVEELDVVSTSLDGLREQLLGLRYDGGLARLRDPVTQELGPPQLNGQPPLWLRGGVLRLARARIVDAYGRTLEVPLARLHAPQRIAVAPAAVGAGEGLRLAPRLNLPARAMFRLVDPGADGPTPAEANVDQVEPTRMVNPVSGFVLPDHIDESLEFFDAAGTPLGQLTHEPIGGGVIWEMAPGRDGPGDAGPLHGLSTITRHLGYIAAGAVTADARARTGDVQPSESALSALLRAIDTTLWSVDALAAMGTEHIAGLVGRPIAVVRARLSLDVQPDGGLDPAVAMAALADRAFTVRLGEITRSDDALLAYFVDDNYERVHVVDKVVAQLARDSGRLRGQLAGLDRSVVVPALRPIDHPYVVAEDELKLRFGRTVTLTLLMHPMGKVHLTSGILPRKSLQLAREWVSPGLSVMAPSARIGPVLVDPANVRLPKISAFPKDQLFTRRDTPGTWKDDPILAATQEALLPDLPHEVQEGYIRIAPETGTAKGG